MATPTTRGGARAGAGRRALYRDKRGRRVQGRLTRLGTRAFEAQRRFLAQREGLPRTKVSDADVIEYLATEAHARTPEGEGP